MVSQIRQIREFCQHVFQVHLSLHLLGVSKRLVMCLRLISKGLALSLGVGASLPLGKETTTGVTTYDQFRPAATVLPDSASSITIPKTVPGMVNLEVKIWRRNGRNR